MLASFVKGYTPRSETKTSNYFLLNATLVCFSLNFILLIGEGKAYKAYEVLKDCTQNANRYKFALTCIKLNKLQEAEKALLNRKQARPL